MLLEKEFAYLAGIFYHSDDTTMKVTYILVGFND